MAQVFASVYVTAAELAGESSKMDYHAGRVLKAARREAAQAKDTGAFLRSLHIEVVGRRKDRIIVAEGEGVFPIEYGYVTTTGKVVPGLGIMRKALYSVKSV
jgi:hypothetical protein